MHFYLYLYFPQVSFIDTSAEIPRCLSCIFISLFLSVFHLLTRLLRFQDELSSISISLFLPVFHFLAFPRFGGVSCISISLFLSVFHFLTCLRFPGVFHAFLFLCFFLCLPCDTRLAGGEAKASLAHLKSTPPGC